MKLMQIVGTRPQLIKLIDIPGSVIINTGQHWDQNLNDIFEYKHSIDDNLNTTYLGEMIDGLIPKIKSHEPDLVVVYGDTNSALAGALAARQVGIPVAHIEAGVRSFQKDSIEESNRITIDHLSELLFCPTIEAKKNLELEHVKGEIHVVGDVLKDVYLAERQSRLKEEFYLLTLHRRENVDSKEKFEDLIDELSNYSHVIWPIHPHARENIRKFDMYIPDNIELIEPVGYEKMYDLIDDATMVLTDSGGVERECYFHGVPVKVLGYTSSWTEPFGDGMAKVKIQMIIDDWLKKQ